MARKRNVAQAVGEDFVTLGMLIKLAGLIWLACCLIF